MLLYTELMGRIFLCVMSAIKAITTRTKKILIIPKFFKYKYKYMNKKVLTFSGQSYCPFSLYLSPPTKKGKAQAYIIQICWFKKSFHSKTIFIYIECS